MLERHLHYCVLWAGLTWSIAHRRVERHPDDGDVEQLRRRRQALGVLEVREATYAGIWPLQPESTSNPHALASFHDSGLPVWTTELSQAHPARQAPGTTRCISPNPSRQLGHWAGTSRLAPRVARLGGGGGDFGDKTAGRSHWSQRRWTVGWTRTHTSERASRPPLGGREGGCVALALFAMKCPRSPSWLETSHLEPSAGLRLPSCPRAAVSSPEAARPSMQLRGRTPQRAAAVIVPSGRERGPSRRMA